MGKWKSFSGVSVSKLDDAIFKVMEEYGDIIFKATDEGIAAAAEELKRQEKAATPKKSGKFARGWKVESLRYKLVRYVGNNAMVPSKNGDVSQANIFEYSTTRGKPFIKRTFEANAGSLAQIIVNRIKEDA